MPAGLLSRGPTENQEFTRRAGPPAHPRGHRTSLENAGGGRGGNWFRSSKPFTPLDLSFPTCMKGVGLQWLIPEEGSRTLGHRWRQRPLE